MHGWALRGDPLGEAPCRIPSGASRPQFPQELRSPMFLHVQRLINEIVPDEPDPAAANALQEGLGGQFGEMRTMMQYLFQAFNFRGATGKPYKDLLYGVGTEEIGHVELIATTIARLTDGAPQYNGRPRSPLDEPGKGGATPLSTALSAGNIHHYLVGAQGALPVDAAGNPWSGSYVYNSGNLVLGPAVQPHARVDRPSAEVPHLRDDRQQDGARDDRLPDRARPGPRERLRQGAGVARGELGRGAADPQDRRRAVPRGQEAARAGPAPQAVHVQRGQPRPRRARSTAAPLRRPPTAAR